MTFNIRQIGLWSISLMAAAWVLTIILSGIGYNAFGVDWNFERTGQLGDSFGVLSSGMAAIAAYFAYSTYKSSIDESKIAERRAFESSFLNLVERRFDLLDRINVSETQFGGGGVRTFEYSGQLALDKIKRNLYSTRGMNFKNLAELYDNRVGSVSGLASYLRYTYHLVALLERQYGRSDKQVDKDSHEYTLLRLLRAQMTDSELLIIALNCVVGSGHGKFRPLVEKYAILHNIDDEDREHFNLSEFFSESAFGLSRDDRSMPDDMPPLEWAESLAVPQEKSR